MRSMEVIAIPQGFLRDPDYVEAVILVANTAQSVALPAGTCYLLFASEEEFFVAYGTAVAPATAVIPGASTSNGSSNEMNPQSRYIRDKSQISIIAKGAGIVTIAMYQV